MLRVTCALGGGGAFEMVAHLRLGFFVAAVRREAKHRGLRDFWLVPESASLRAMLLGPGASPEGTVTGASHALRRRRLPRAFAIWSGVASMMNLTIGSRALRKLSTFSGGGSYPATCCRVQFRVAHLPTVRNS